MVRSGVSQKRSSGARGQCGTECGRRHAPTPTMGSLSVIKPLLSCFQKTQMVPCEGLLPPLLRALPPASTKEKRGDAAERPCRGLRRVDSVRRTPLCSLTAFGCWDFPVAFWWAVQMRLCNICTQTSCIYILISLSGKLPPHPVLPCLWLLFL